MPAPSSSASSAYYNSSSRQSSLSHTQKFDIKQFSSLAQDWDGDDNGGDNNGIHHGGGGGGIGGSGHNHRRNNSSPLLPISHSRKLPPSVCPPTNLRSEVESIFDATIGSLIVYSNPGEGELKSVEEEIAHAYYASDAIVQRVEYIMRGLNAMVSDESFVARSLKRGVMSYEEEDGGDSSGGGGEERMGKEDCFRAMLDLMERMAKEGEAYDELRTRMRSHSSSSDDSDSSSDEDSDGEGGVDGNEADKSFDKWEKSMTQSMSKAGYPTGNTANDNDDDSEEEEEVNEEDYQFGADPGITTHMYDLVLDSLACLCQEQYGKSTSSSSSVDVAELMPAGASPPELAKELLDAVLNRHWMDGGDIGLGGGGSEGSMNGIAGGVGVGAGTGAGALAGQSPFDTNFDVRTCPTPMTFNAVIRVSANFDPARHAEAVENAKVLSGAMGLSSSSGSNANNVDSLKQEQDRLRDVTIDAALSTYSRMQVCSALTLRSLKASTKRATSRSALKRQAKLLADSYKKKNGIITGRNSATYAYLIQTLGNCIPPSLSRGNMTFAMYHKGCVKEGVMDEHLITAMRAVGGYDDEGDANIEDGEGAAPPPPVSNGPLFDSFMQKELGDGVAAALENGRRLRQDRNYKLRRHVEWDDTY
ncbi:hypothetical protein ACHAXR_004194 [Thalassiosira sp. AJA248-18]